LIQKTDISKGKVGHLDLIGSKKVVFRPRAKTKEKLSRGSKRKGENLKFNARVSGAKGKGFDVGSRRARQYK